jgi:acyl-CoA dehydrogenase
MALTILNGVSEQCSDIQQAFQDDQTQEAAMSASATTAEPHAHTDSAFHLDLQAEARQVASEFAERAQEVRGHLLEHNEMHPELWREFSDRGWPGLAIPSSEGGADGGLLGMAIVLDAFAAEGILLWMPVLSAAISYAISQVGPDAAKEEWLGRVAAGEATLALAATEPESGHNLFRAKTEIRRDDEGYVVNGFKRVTSGLDVADRVLVFGRAPQDADAGGKAFTTVLVDPTLPVPRRPSCRCAIGRA